VYGGAERTTRLDTQRLPTRMDGIDLSKFVIGRLEEALLIATPGVRMSAASDAAGRVWCHHSNLERGSNKMTNNLELTA